MRCCWLAASLALVAACTGPGSAVVMRNGDGGVVRRAGSNAVAGDATPGRPPDVVELTLDPPVSVACVLPSPSWSGDLQLRAGGPVFASVAAQKSTLLVPRDRAAAFVTVHAPIELNGVLTVPRLYLAKPTPLGGFIVPLADTLIPAPGPHAAGRLSVAFDIRELFSDPGTVVQELPCDAITTMPADYDVRKWLRLPSGEPPEIQIEPGAGFRTSPDASPVARVGFASKVWLTGGWGSGKRRVVLEGQRYFAIGWVTREDVQPRRMGVGFGGLGRLGRMHAGHSRLLRCARDLPVFVQIGDERARVGALRAGEGFIRQARPPKELAKHLGAGEVAIEVPGSWLDLAPGALMFAKEKHLDDC